jgi:hypothetical protein
MARTDEATTTASGHETITYPYEEAKRLAGEGVWSVMLPDAPNIDPDDVVVVCVGPRPDVDLYDACAADAGGDPDRRWITLAMIGTIEGELEMLTTDGTSFLDNYRWTRAEQSPLPTPVTIAELVGIVSGARTRDENPLPAAAARTVIDAMTADSMKGHVGTTLPGGTLISWFANLVIFAMAAIVLAGMAVMSDPQRFAGTAKVVAWASIVLATSGILVGTFYSRELVGMKRIPDGYVEGRAKVVRYLGITCIMTGLMALTLMMLTSVATA